MLFAMSRIWLTVRSYWICSFWVLCAPFLITAANGDVWISELGALNENGPEDEDGDNEDWIELFNDGSEAVALGGYYLSDDPDDLTRWQIPDGFEIAPGAFHVVFASGKDRKDLEAPLHTSFRLSGDGEWVLLTEPDGLTVVHSVEFPTQTDDVSWALPTGQEVWDFENQLAPFRWTLSASSETENEFLNQPLDGLTDWKEGNAWGLGYEKGTSPVGDLGYAQRVQALNPVGYWRLEEQENVTEVANSGASGSLAGGIPDGEVLFGEEPWNSDSSAAALFHASGGGKVDVDYLEDLNPEVFTVELWARVDGGQGSYRSPITSRDDHPQRGYVIYASASDRWEFWTGRGEQTGWNSLAGPAVAIGEWVYLVAQYDGTRMLFYVNGELVGQMNTGFGPNRARPLRIGGGATEGSGQYFFEGAIDEVAVYSEILSAGVIQEHYEVGIPRIDPGTGERLTRDYDPWIQTEIVVGESESPNGVYVRTAIDSVLSGAISPASPWPFHELELGMQYDDAYALYWNGQLVHSANAPAQLNWNSLAQARRSDLLAVQVEKTIWNWEEAVEDGWTWRGDQPNDLGLHVLNASVEGDPDLLVRPALIGRKWRMEAEQGWKYFMQPTPGKPNLVDDNASELGPIILDVKHSPEAPAEEDPVLIEVEVAAAPGLEVASVDVSFRIMYQSERMISLNDQGVNGDREAGDGIYSGTIQPRVNSSEQMVRYRVRARDTQGGQSMAPFPRDLSGDRQSPEYYGWVDDAIHEQGGTPVFYWYSANPQQAHTRAGSRVSVYYQGDFIDNAFARERGQATAFGSQKFEFDADHQIRLGPELGRVRDLNLNSNGADPIYIRQPLAFQVFRDFGSASPISFPLEMRVNGEFDRLGILIEQVDEDFLQRNDLDPEGALYKFVQRRELTPAFSNISDGLEKKTRLDEDFSDLARIVDALRSRNPQHIREMLFEELDLPAVVNYLAARALVRDVDSIRKNFYFYRDTCGDRKWRFLPWDKDLSLGTGVSNAVGSHPFLGAEQHPLPSFDQWNVLMDAMYKDPWIRAMYLRRLRTLMDQALANDTTQGNAFFTSRVLEIARRVGPYINGGERAAASGILDFWNRHRDFMYRVHTLEPGESAPFPAVGSLSAGIPPAALDADEIFIQIAGVDYSGGDSENNPPSGVVVVSNEGSNAVDMSGWKLNGAAVFQFPAGFVLPAQMQVSLAESWTQELVIESLAEPDPSARVAGMEWWLDDGEGRPPEWIRLVNDQNEVIDEIEFQVTGDLDSDGMADEWERHYFGATDFSNGMYDTDQDGRSDRLEFEIGTDPNVADGGDWLQMDWNDGAGKWRIRIVLGEYSAPYYEDLRLILQLQQSTDPTGIEDGIRFESWNEVETKEYSLNAWRDGAMEEIVLNFNTEAVLENDLNWFRVGVRFLNQTVLD